jgi:hypothetical protein
MGLGEARATENRSESETPKPRSNPDGAFLLAEGE